MNCPSLCGLPCKLVKPEGPENTAIVLIGEAPGADEELAGRPFVGKAGQELNNYLLRVGLLRTNIYITNVLKCRPPGNRDPKKSEVESCFPLLFEELTTLRPRIIITAGRVSTRLLLGDVDMENVHGIPFWTETINNLPLGFRATVIPVYHPARGLHDSTNMSVIMADFMAVRDTIDGKIKPRDVHQGRGDVDYTVWDGDERDLSPLIAIDTEIEKGGVPWSVQFSCMEKSARFVMRTDISSIEKLARFVSTPGVVTILHNALFDLPVLMRLGIIPNKFVDTMVMAYLLQTEPQGLKPLAFRHLGISRLSYEEMVGPRTQEIAREYLTKALEIDWGKPEPVIEVRGGELKIRKPQPIDTKIKKALSRKGEDLYDWWSGIEPEAGRGMVEAVLGELHPAYLSDIDFEDALNYACADADDTLSIYPMLMDKIKAWGLEDVLDRDMRMLPMVSDMQETGIKGDAEYFRKLSEEFTERMNQLSADIEKLVGTLNPGSDKQVFELLRRLKIEKKSKMYKGATDHARLEAIEHRHPAIPLIAAWRGYRKLQGTFLDVLPTRMGDDARIRTTLRITRVVTGRLSSSNPNLMAQPVRTEDGRKIRGGFVAEDGFTLLSGDYSQVEMRCVAHISQDPLMMDVYRTGKDIHTETAMRMFKIPKENVDELKHRYPAKRIGFGILYQISPQKLLKELEVSGAAGYTLMECQNMIDRWFDTYSGVKAWVEEQKLHARRYGYVRDMWGRIRLVPEIISVHPRIVEAGIRQAVNAPIQMSAQGIIKEAMAQLVPLYKSYDGLVRPLLQIHDDLLFEVREDLVEEFLQIAKEVMEGCVPWMTVPLEVEFKMGKRWNEMKKIKKEDENGKQAA